MFGTFDVIPKRKRITFFKFGKLWVFKQFFDNRALFDALLNYYNKDLFRFEFKSTGARNNALKLLEKNGFAIAGAGAREAEQRGHPLPVITRKLSRAQWLAAQSTS